MESPKNKSQAYQFTNPRQKEIHKELSRLIGYGTADFFIDACQLISGDLPLRSNAHLTAHLLREINGTFVDVMLPFGYQPPRTKKGEIKKKGTYRHKLNKIALLYGIKPNSKLISEWLKLGKDKGGLFKLAHRQAGNTRKIDDDFMEVWENAQTVFSLLLDRIGNNFVRYVDEIDRLLKKPSLTKDDIKHLKNDIPNNSVTLGYFFEKLDKPDCLATLDRQKYFDNPFEAVVHPDGGISYPYWPQSQYLMKMAKVKAAHEKVLEICRRIESDNVRVQADILEIATILPADLSVKLVQKVKPWVKSGYRWLLPERYGSLISHLAKSGKTAEALDLAASVLGIQQDPKYPQQFGEGDQKFTMPPDPTGWFDEHEYNEILEKNIPELIAASGIDGIKLFADLLNDYVNLVRVGDKNSNMEDYSYIWQPAIEDHIQNHMHGIKTALVVVLRKACEQTIVAHPESIRSIVELLDKYRWKIFNRLLLHLIRIHPEKTKSRIEKEIVNRERYGNMTFDHEYYLLVQAHGNMLSATDRKGIMSWIEAGPEYLENYKKRLEKEGTKMTPENEKIHIKMWKQHHLSPFVNHFPEYKTLYDELTKELGHEPEHPEFKSYMESGSFGPTSPMTAKEISEQALTKTIEFLKTWEPKAQRFDPSPEGLGRELTAAVKADPQKFGSKAEEFRDLDPTYVRSLISGFREAIKENRKIPWKQVLGLCLWVVEQPKKIPERKLSGPFSEDPDWDWCFNTIAEFIDEGLRADAIPLESKELVWKILEKLSDDPNPTPEDEKTRPEEKFDPATLAINSTRPEALHAVMRYGLWMRKEEEKRVGRKRAEMDGFRHMPEVRNMLEKHLDIANDPSLAVRSVYGQWLPWLTMFDRDWVTENLGKIFPVKPELKKYRDTAWETYISFCHPYKKSLDVLAGEHSYYIGELGRHNNKRHHLSDPDERLAQHLSAYYWGGTLDLSKGSLICKFYDNANDEIAASFMASIGRGLHDVKTTVSIETLKRLKRLLLKRLHSAILGKPTDHVNELSEFGWWFVSGKYDEKWSLDILNEILELIGEIEADHQVSEKLVELSLKYPYECLKAITAMVKGDKKGWGAMSWKDDIKLIIKNALSSANPRAKKKAKDLVSIMISSGFTECKELLKNNP